MGKMCRLCSQINTEGSHPAQGTEEGTTQNRQPPRHNAVLGSGTVFTVLFVWGTRPATDLPSQGTQNIIFIANVTVTEQFRSNTAQLRIKNEQEFGPFTCPQLTKAELVQVATKPCFPVEQSCVNKYMAGFPERQLPMHTCPQLVSTSALTVEDLGSD